MEKIEKIEIIDDGMICFDDKYQDIFIGGCNPTVIAFSIKINEIIERINEILEAINNAETSEEYVHDSKR